MDTPEDTPDPKPELKPEPKPEPKIVTRAQWLAARRELLTREKQFTRERDALSKARRQLPWVEVTKDYRFQTTRGERSLAELFDGRSQLLVYHFMFGPDWDEGCPSCSFWADNFDGVDVHLAARDMTLLAISRAPLAKLLAYRERLGWRFEWVSSHGSEFNYDFRVSFTPEEIEAGEMDYNFTTSAFPSSEAPGASVFAKRDGKVFHTYSCYARGLDILNGAYHWMDLAPNGRDEDSLPYSMAWLRRRDAY